MIGRTIADRYRVTEKLATGEHLSSYIALDTTYGTEVEVDILEAEAEWPVPPQRLEELLDAALPAHGPHISSLLAWGRDEEGALYMVREKARGALLSEVLESTRELPRQQVAEIVRAAVEVLAEAYGRGLFYLGLNPGQVLLGGRGDVKFQRVGFAWVLEEMEPHAAARVSPYRAPETDRGKEGTRTSDVFALAVMVREMLPPDESGGRLGSLLQMAVDPLPRRRPSSPRLLLEELEASEVIGLRPPPDSGAGESAAPPRGGGGLSFLAGEDAPPFVDLSRRPRRRILRNLLLVLAGGLVLWLGFAAVTGLLRGEPPGEQQEAAAVEEKVTLPDLQGLTLAEAEGILDDLGLRYTSREAPSRLWSAGRVAAQEPAEGSPLLPGESVLLVVSSGTGGEPVAETSGSQPQQEPVSPAVTAPTAEPSPPAEPSPAPPVSPQQESPPAFNLPPHAVPAVSASSGPAPLYVAMDGSASYDPDGGIVRYIWHCGDGTVIEGSRAQHVYDPAVIPARFQVVLEVYDASGLSHSSAIVLEVY